MPIALAQTVIPQKLIDEAVNQNFSHLMSRQHALAVTLVYDFRADDLAMVLNHRTNDAIAWLSKSEGLEKNLLTGHARSFRGRYDMPREVSTYLLKYASDKANQPDSTELESMSQIHQVIKLLIETGANPFPVIANHAMKASEAARLLALSPPGAARSFNGANLHHAKALHSDYVKCWLPVLDRYGADFNEVSKTIGTPLHVMLAAEALPAALDFVQSPVTAGRLKPYNTDGQRKTIAITAAKVRAEDVLLALADRYPETLALDAYDADGRTALHYCIALGLDRAADRLMAIGADPESADSQGRTPIDYLRLPRIETDYMLRGIGIDPDRDARAEQNFIVGGTIGRPPVLHGHLPFPARRQSFTPQVFSAALAQFGELGVKVVREQEVRMSGQSLLDVIFEKRLALAKELNAHRSLAIRPVAAISLAMSSRRSFDPR
jgi:hypothetical protein